MNIKISHPPSGVFSHEQIVRFRNDTPGVQNVVHFNNAGCGLMTSAVTKAQVDHLTLESQIGGYEASAMKAATISEFYHTAASLFNCKPSNLAFTASATDAYTRALSSIPFERDDVILVNKDDFVSNQIQFLSLRKRIGVTIVYINNKQSGGVDVNDLSEKLNLHKPKLLAITHIPTNSGLVQPVNDIAEVYKEYTHKYPDKTWYILDACQSAGQMKLDVQKLGCDFLSVTCRKFLRGPRGTGALFVSDRALYQNLEPMFIDMRGAEWKEKDLYEQNSTAMRYEDWEFAYSTVIGTQEAIKYCLSIGEDKIWQQVKLLSSYMRTELTELGKVKVLDKGDELGGLVTFHVERSDPKYLVNELLKRKINVVPSYRAFAVMDFDEKGVEWAIRASPHYYNTIDEIDLLVQALNELC